MSEFYEPWMVSEFGRFLGGKPWTIMGYIDLGMPRKIVEFDNESDEPVARRVVACVNLLRDLSNDDIALLASGRETHWREAIDGCLRRMRKEPNE